MTAEQNYRLLMEIEADRHFLLLAYAQNPRLLARAEPRIRQLFADGLDVIPAFAAHGPSGPNMGQSST